MLIKVELSTLEMVMVRGSLYNKMKELQAKELQTQNASRKEIYNAYIKSYQALLSKLEVL